MAGSAKLEGGECNWKEGWIWFGAGFVDCGGVWVLGLLPTEGGWRREEERLLGLGIERVGNQRPPAARLVCLLLRKCLSAVEVLFQI